MAIYTIWVRDTEDADRRRAATADCERDEACDRADDEVSPRDGSRGCWEAVVLDGSGMEVYRVGK